MSILVTGATGNVGRHLVEQLSGAGHRVRAFTRRPDSARFPDGVETAGGDLLDPASFEAALDGVTALHLLTTLAPSYEPLSIEYATELVGLAAKAGVRHVTVLWNGQRDPLEEAVERSGLGWTHLHPGSFMSNDLAWAEEIRSEGVVREPFPDAAHRMIDEADIAAVAAAALTAEGHAGQTYTLTGPEALAVPARVAAIARAAGREVRYEELSRAAAHERMRGMGIDDEAADFVLDWNADPSNDEELAANAADIAAITGRPAGTYAEWAERHAASFR